MASVNDDRKDCVFKNELRKEKFSVIIRKSMSKEGPRVKVVDVFPSLEPEMDEKAYYPCAYLLELCNEGLLRDMIPKKSSDVEYLKELCDIGLSKRYAEVSQAHETRIDHEIALIDETGLVSGFLIIRDLIEYARCRNIMVSPGCGTLPGSLVAYCLGITGVDPLREDLIFERYLNTKKEMHSYGIRIEVEKGAKALILNYLSEKYGNGMPKLFELLDICIKERVELSIIKETVENIAKNKEINVDVTTIDKNDPDVYKYLCSGATDGVFYFDKDDPHTYTTGGWLDEERNWHYYHPPIVMEDEKLFRAIMPKSKKELMAFLCQDRRLPEEIVERYLYNKNNPARITYECLELEPILSESCGCVIYQEQIMQILQDLAGFSPEQSDLCRRALSKRAQDETEEYRKWFVEGSIENNIPGCVAKGISEDVAEIVYKSLCNDAPRSFNKSHASCLAAMIYDMVWLKFHYGKEFQKALEKYKGMESDLL